MLKKINSSNTFPYLFYLTLTILFYYKFVFVGSAFLPADIIYSDYPWKYYSSVSILHNTFISDVIDQYIPNNIVMSNAIKNGTLPLWNPYSLGGYPLLANPSNGAAYPVKLLLYYFFDPIIAHGINLMVHTFLMGIWMYLFAISINLKRYGALLAGLVWMFNGCTMVWLEFEYAVTIGAWTPFLFFCAEKYFHNKQIKWLLFSGIAIGMTMLGGMPQLAVYVTILFSCYFVMRSWLSIKTLLVSVPLTIGAATAAVQILPTFELLQLSQRPKLSYEYITKVAGFFPIENIITFFIPNFFGNPVDGYYFARGASVNDAQNYVELTGYCGLLPILLALAAIFFYKKRSSYFFTGTLAITLLAAMGSPVYYLIYSFVPGFNKLKAISRILIIATFSISILSGMGADFIFEQSSKKIKKIFICVFSFLLVVFIVLPLLASKFINKQTIDSSINLAKHFTLANNSFYSPIFFLFLCGILFYCLNSNTNKKFLKAFATLIIIIDLFYFGWRFNTISDRQSIYPSIKETDIIQANTKQPVSRVMTVGIRPNLFMPYMIQSVGGYNGLYPKIYFDFTNLIEEKINKEIKHFVYFSKPYLTNLVNLLNVKYFLISPDINYNLKDLKKEPVQALDIYENANLLPRAFIVHNTKYIENDTTVLAELAKQAFNPAVEALVQEPVQLQSNSGKAIVKIEEYSTNHIFMSAQTDNDGLLVLSDTYYPGWKAFIDGEEKKIIRTNYAFRGVKIEKGKHTIEFIYTPFSFKLGLSISLFSTIFVIIFSLRNHSKDKLTQAP